MNAVAEQIDPRTAVVTILTYEGRANGIGPKDLLAVRPGILEAGDGHALEGNRAFLIRHALESAKAIIDAVRDGAEAAK